MRVHFEKLFDEHGNNDLIPVCLKNDTPNFYLNRDVRSEETHSVRDAEQNFEKTDRSRVGTRIWQSASLERPTTTLNRDAVRLGDDIEPVEEILTDVEEEERNP